MARLEELELRDNPFCFRGLAWARAADEDRLLRPARVLPALLMTGC